MGTSVAVYSKAKCSRPSGLEQVCNRKSVRERESLRGRCWTGLLLCGFCDAAPPAEHWQQQAGRRHPASCCTHPRMSASSGRRVKKDKLTSVVGYWPGRRVVCRRRLSLQKNTSFVFNPALLTGVQRSDWWWWKEACCIYPQMHAADDLRRVVLLWAYGLEADIRLTISLG